MDDEIKSLFKKGISERKLKFGIRIICGIIIGPGILLLGLVSFFGLWQNIDQGSRNNAGLIGVGIAGCLLLLAFILINRYQSRLQKKELLALDSSNAPAEIVLKIQKPRRTSLVVRTPPSSCVIFRREKSDMILPLPVDKARRLFSLMQQKYQDIKYSKIDEYENL
jgi:hypothetical protein